MFWDPWPWLEGSYELGSLCLSFCSSVLPCRSFLGIGSLVFSETQHSVRRPCVVVRSKAIFLKKSFCPQNWENGPKSGFFEFIGKISHFFLNLVYKENLYLLYCCTNPILAKNLISEIWAECSWPIRLHFKLTISLEQKQWKSLIFCMLMQVHRN